MEKIPVRQMAEPDFSDSFTIRDMDSLLSGKDLVQELHRHDFFLILALEKGEGEHIIDFIPYAINNYTVFFIRPGQVHQLTLKNASKGYLMQFKTDFYAPREKTAHQIFLKVSNKNYCPLNAEKFRKIFSFLTCIFREYTHKQERYQDAIKANLELLFIELVRQSQEPNRIHTQSHPYAQERLEALLQLLQQHITTTKKVTQYADMLHLTAYQLNSITKETLNKTCSDLINEHIILEAKRHLLATSNQVNQIAYELGYEDVSYFIRFFKKHTGYSPETFRQNFK
ncbi:AraC-type DNA-binding protein [Flexibacter flexilis DSM 6793]|uniref:AraC-type DNA-binding protein n=1 Tax=Flexibacter flexilis DSM 6793 TaxID=927664 RepID=A0A1I1DUU7_9BACT|nr:helix-turn-helix domain-containing protein [Flexibacter flexilis]SFB76808.1 AraC-type DNA-binding protein [Flexibacter flexilis DSM 6793]